MNTPVPVRYYYYDPETAEQWEEHVATIQPRRIFPGRLQRRNAFIRNREIARHYCERQSCLLCKPYRD